MLTSSTMPDWIRAVAMMEQNAMWIIVRAIGYGKPLYDSTYLL